MSGDAQALACPGGCAADQRADALFCSECGLPLVPRGGPYTHGELVRVAGGRNLAEAEFIQALLREEGVPSIQRRSRGFDVPDFLAAGPRDVLVPAGGAATARDVLLQTDLAPTGDAAGPRPALVLAALVGGMAVLFLVALLLG